MKTPVLLQRQTHTNRFGPADADAIQMVVNAWQLASNELARTPGASFLQSSQQLGFLAECQGLPLRGWPWFLEFLANVYACSAGCTAFRSERKERRKKRMRGIALQCMGEIDGVGCARSRSGYLGEIWGCTDSEWANIHCLHQRCRVPHETV